MKTFKIRLSANATCTYTVKAETQKEAEAKVDKLLENDFDIYKWEIDSCIDTDWIREVKPTSNPLLK